MKYNLNDKPGLFPMLMYGLQWWLVSIPSIIILGIVVTQIHNTGTDGQIFYMQKLFGVMGIALIAQILWGHRLPLVIGPASVLLIGVLATQSSGIDAIYTSMLIGGVFLSVISFSGILSRLQAIFTPRIIIVILCLIAFTLSPVILKLMFGDAERILFNLFFTLIAALFMIIANQLLKGIWKSTVILWAIFAGSLIFNLMNGNPGQSVSSSPEIIEMNISFFQPLQFDAGVTLSFLFCFIALIVNELGSIQAVGKMIGADQMKKRTVRGVGIVGLSNILSASIGVVGPIDYSMSPGIISATGCASRYPLIPAGIGLIACAFFPGFIGLLSAIPGVVMAAVLLYLMASQLSAGMQMLTIEKAVQNFNHGIIIGFPLMTALLLSFAPEEASSHIPALIRPIAGNGFVMGVITVLILEHWIFRKK